MEVQKVRPLILTEKILVAHAADLDHQVWERTQAKPGKDNR